MAINRKGFLFTSLAIILVLGIVILSSGHDRLYPRAVSEGQRAQLINGYLINLDADLPRAAYIAGFRGLIGLEEHISTTGQYLPAFDTDFTSIFTNGTVNGTFYGIMNDSSFDNFSTRFSTLAANQGLVANLSVLSVNASQVDPWNMQLNVSVAVYLSERSGAVYFNTTMNITTTIPITDIKDPLYTIGTSGRVPHTIQRSNDTRPYIGAGNVTTKLQNMINGSFYIASTNAPSLVQRFEGNFSASPYGIQSLVPIDELRTQGVAITSCKSVVDYKYFDATNTNPNNFIINMPVNDFWLANSDLADYDASSSVAGAAPCP